MSIRRSVLPGGGTCARTRRSHIQPRARRAATHKVAGAHVAGAVGTLGGSPFRRNRTCVRPPCDASPHNRQLSAGTGASRRPQPMRPPHPLIPSISFSTAPRRRDPRRARARRASSDPASAADHRSGSIATGAPLPRRSLGTGTISLLGAGVPRPGGAPKSGAGLDRNLAPNWGAQDSELHEGIGAMGASGREGARLSRSVAPTFVQVLRPDIKEGSPDDPGS